MISYNPKHWFLFIFKIHKAETFRQLFPLMFLLGVYSFIVYLVFVNFLHVSPKGRMANLSVMYSVLGFVISLLLVFRTNTAYERWWEGRKLWGSLINTSRNLAIKLQTFLPAQNHSFFKQSIPDYSVSLMVHLQNVTSNEHPNKQNKNESNMSMSRKLALIPFGILVAIVILSLLHPGVPSAA